MYFLSQNACKHEFQLNCFMQSSVERKEKWKESRYNRVSPGSNTVRFRSSSHCTSPKWDDQHKVQSIQKHHIQHILFVVLKLKCVISMPLASLNQQCNSAETDSITSFAVLHGSKWAVKSSFGEISFFFDSLIGGNFFTESGLG